MMMHDMQCSTSLFWRFGGKICNATPQKPLLTLQLALRGNFKVRTTNSSSVAAKESRKFEYHGTEHSRLGGPRMLWHKDVKCVVFR
jgi:hypothetical protein